MPLYVSTKHQLIEDILKDEECQAAKLLLLTQQPKEGDIR